jgi:hypothetical protein
LTAFTTSTCSTKGNDLYIFLPSIGVCSFVDSRIAAWISLGLCRVVRMRSFFRSRLNSRGHFYAEFDCLVVLFYFCFFAGNLLGNFTLQFSSSVLFSEEYLCKTPSISSIMWTLWNLILSYYVCLCVRADGTGWRLVQRGSRTTAGHRWRQPGLPNTKVLTSYHPENENSISNLHFLHDHFFNDLELRVWVEVNI